MKMGIPSKSDDQVHFRIVQSGNVVTVSRETLEFLLQMPNGGWAKVDDAGEIGLCQPFIPLRVTEGFT